MFKPLANFEGRYEISTSGTIRNSKTKREIKQYKDKDGYIVVFPFNGIKTTTLGVHRAIALTFIDNINSKPTVNHIDGNKSNNSIDNLEWSDYKEQSIHSIYVLGNNLKENGNRYIEVDVSKVNDLLEQGISQDKIAKQLNIAQSMVSRIKNGNRFKIVQGADE